MMRVRVRPGSRVVKFCGEDSDLLDGRPASGGTDVSESSILTVGDSDRGSKFSRLDTGWTTPAYSTCLGTFRPGSPFRRSACLFVCLTERASDSWLTVKISNGSLATTPIFSNGYWRRSWPWQPSCSVLWR